MSLPTSVDASAPVLAHHEIDIQAPVDSVWAIHVDVNGWTSWNPDMTSAHLEGVLEPGVSFDWESYGFPVTSTVYEVDRHHRRARVALFTPTPGGTHVTTNESFSGEPVRADAAGMQSLLDSSLVAWLGHLKETVENPSLGVD